MVRQVRFRPRSSLRSSRAKWSDFVGTGKTKSVSYLASQLQIPFAAFKDSDINSSLVSRSSHLFDALFACCQLLQPVVVLLDEADSLFPAHGPEHAVRDTSIRKAYLSGDELPTPGLLLVLATNNLGKFDPAIKSRMEVCEVPSPLPAKQRLVWTSLLQHSRFAKLYDESLLNQLVSRNVTDLRFVEMAIKKAERKAINRRWGEQPVFNAEDILEQLDEVCQSNASGFHRILCSYY
jgi:SpoVK/Ycf46/Vps4 family AAA+-type ATPase